MHPLMVLVAFTLAALVTFALVVAALDALTHHEDEHEDSQGRDDAPAWPDLGSATPLPPWVPAVAADRIRHEHGQTDHPTPDRRSHVPC